MSFSGIVKGIWGCIILILKIKTEKYYSSLYDLNKRNNKRFPHHLMALRIYIKFIHNFWGKILYGNNITRESILENLK